MSAQAKPVHAISAEVSTRIDRPAAQVFATIVPVDLSSIFKGHWPIPAVVGTRNQSGPWVKAGESRTVLLSDDSTAEEHLLAVSPSKHFSYRVEKFTGTLGGLADHANGEWWFDEDEATHGTAVRWKYEFVAKSGCSAIALEALVALFWKKYMAEALQAAKVQVESSPPARPEMPIPAHSRDDARAGTAPD